MVNPFTLDSAEYKTDRFCKITTWVKLKIQNKQHHSIKVLLNSFPLNGETLENFISFKVNVISVDG